MRILEAKITVRDGVQLTTEKCPHCVKGAPVEGYYIRWGGAEIPKEMVS
jgi:hypothetical protein